MEVNVTKYLKDTHFSSAEETAARIAQCCVDCEIDIYTLLSLLLKSNQQKCRFNFIDDAERGFCCDTDGQEVAFGLDAIAEAYGLDREHITCKEINDRGCCARINCMLSNLEFGMYEYLESKKGLDETGRTETKGESR